MGTLASLSCPPDSTKPNGKPEDKEAQMIQSIDTSPRERRAKNGSAGTERITSSIRKRQEHSHLVERAFCKL